MTVRERILQVTVDERSTGVGMSGAPLPQEIEVIDAYNLFDAGLDDVAGISIASGCDQIFLDRHRDEIDAFVRDGGRVLFCGHVVVPFIAGMSKWRKLAYSGPKDLFISSLAPHPLWRGVDFDDLLFRTGVPGRHSFEEMHSIGVSGFYGRGYHLHLPADAVALNGIGPLRAPIDYEFPLGRGRVVIHGGLDLFSQADEDRSTAAFSANIVRWLKGEDQ